MPSSSEKSTKTLPDNTSGSTKAKPKTPPRQGTKPESTSKKESEKETDAPATVAPERKVTSKQLAPKENKSTAARIEARVRKPTPQQQYHIARARRRRLNERLGLGLIAVVLIVVITVVIWQAIAKSNETARLAAAHAAATSTSVVRATATENAVAPDNPPTVTGKTVTLADKLQYIDLKVGTGLTIKAGDTITANYTGWFKSQVNCISTCKFDSSYDHSPPAPASFTLIVGSADNPTGVIKGWVDGIPGMKIGGERRLIIPAALAYGAAGIPGQNPGDPAIIPPNADLVFDVTVVSDPTQTPTPTPTATATASS